MNFKAKIKSLIKEAEFYRAQGLLKEAKVSYEKIIELVNRNLAPSAGKKLIDHISSKIKELEKERRRVEKKVLSPQMTRESQDLITQMFQAADGDDESAAALEGAKALLKFGQFDRAKEELTKLLAFESRRLEAARHIIHCLFLESRYDDAVMQYRDWLNSNLFTSHQLDVLKNFMEKTFKYKGMQKRLPEMTADQDNIIELNLKKLQKQNSPLEEEADQPKRTEAGGKSDGTTEKDNEDFEEFDILASIKKSGKSENKN
ncbi:MAG: hypothetical protein R6U50_06475 [Desulfobacterales bacterium]